MLDTTSGDDELRIVIVCNSTGESGNIDFNNQYEVVLGCDMNTIQRCISVKWRDITDSNNTTGFTR